MALAILLDVAIFVALPLVIWRLTRGVVPLAVLPILIGIALSVGGARFGIEPIAPTAVGDFAGWLGVLLLAFSAGLEARHFADGKDGATPAAVAADTSTRRLLTTALAALALPFLLGTAIAYLGLVQLGGWLPNRIEPLIAAAGIGLCLAVSALPVLVGIVRELADGGERRLGRLAIRIAAIDDVVLWVGLALLLLGDHTGAGLGAWGWQELLATAVIAMLAGLGKLIDRVGRFAPGWLVWLGAALWLAGGAWSTATIGLHALIGAYLAGVLTPAAIARRLPDEQLAFVALAVLAPLFFGHRGLGIDGGVFSFTAFTAAIALFAVSAAAKALAVLLFPPMRAMPPGDRFALGALLQCKGLMEIVAATILRDHGILSETAYAVLVCLAVVSTATTKPLFALFANGEARAAKPASGRIRAG